MRVKNVPFDKVTWNVLIELQRDGVEGIVLGDGDK